MAEIATRTASEMVALIDKAIEAIAVSGVAYGIDGRTLTRSDLKSLLAARSYYTTLVNAEAGKKGGVLSYGIVF